MKTEIKFENYESTVIRIRRSQTFWAFCPQCETQVLHLSIARAAAALRISETAIFRLVESGAVHSMETDGGALFVCGSSVSALAKKIEFIEGEK